MSNVAEVEYDEMIEDIAEQANAGDFDIDPVTGLPQFRNAVTGEPYQGGNIVRLFESVVANGFDPTGKWAGFKQWLSAGRVVRKGQHGTHGMKVIKVEDKKTGKERTAPRGFVVFHVDQTEELPAKETK